MPERHGEMRYVLVDEDLYEEGVPSGSTAIEVHSLTRADSLTAKALLSGPREKLFRYGRMFRRPNLPQYRPDKRDLTALGLAMKETDAVALNPSLPAGYTYLGQFIDHDLSFDVRRKLPGGESSPELERTKRSPSLDLDSLYGLEPEFLKLTALGREVYEPDGIRLRVGSTVDDPFVKPPIKNISFKNDLPRQGESQPISLAMIVDARNDENLPVAQTHLAFIKFHNAVVNRLAGTVPHEQLFERARETVVRHYQWMILDDYLPKIIEEGVLRDVIRNGCKHFVFNEGEDPYMPVEFSAAAFRLGHSQIASEYQWNRYFQTTSFNGAASLEQLFLFTGFLGRDFHTLGLLPGSWIIDWTRFFDFQGFPGIDNNPRSSRSRRVVTSLIPELAEIKIEEGTLISLAVQNLQRGRYIGLPTGQAVAERIEATALTPQEIADGPHRQILQESGFDKLTPLWYYILKEAEVRHEGRLLGPVGSRIVAETFVRLIQTSRTSILPPGPGAPTWTPRDLGITPEKFSMSDLLYFVHRTFPEENFLNPLGA